MSKSKKKKIEAEKAEEAEKQAEQKTEEQAEQKTEEQAEKPKTRTIVFTSKPPRSAYFVGRPQEVSEDKAAEYINLGFATDPKAETKKKSKK
jgi:hypothetical protein